MQTFTLPVDDGTELVGYSWLPEGEPHAAVEIVHGMAEHARRYDRFARALNAAGYAVYAVDLRGHGATAGSQDCLGHFADRGGWERTVADLAAFTSYVRQRQPGLPLAYLGHSMGSMLGRAYAIEHGADIDALILSGTAGDAGALGRIGAAIARLEARLRGRRARSRLLDTMTFGQYNAAFKPTRTTFDWLSRDPDEVDAYVADPLCGNVHTAQFFADLLGGLAAINDPERVRRIPADLPILVISGTDDPVGGKNAAGVRRVVDQLRDAGVRDIEERYPADARHEVLNETNRDEVTAGILDWLGAHLG